MIPRLAILALSAAVLSAAIALPGCAVNHPMTAEEFRQAVPGSFSGKVETFETTRSVKDIAKTFRKKAPECLEVAIETTSQTSDSYSHYITTYKPTVVVSSNRVELHVQRHMDNVVKISEEPEGGYFLLVADAYPVDRKTTRIDLYRPAFGFDILTKAIKGWATGDNLGCPDLTKIG